jgi:hypothetical protein
LINFFGYKNKEELAVKKNEFIYEDKDTIFEWSFEGGLIRLENEEDTKQPILNYILSTKKKKSD